MQQNPYKVSEITVSYRPKNHDNPIVKSSFEAYTFLYNQFPKKTIGLQETFIVMYLNRGNRIIGSYMVSNGGITGTVADIRLILSVALKVAAVNMIISHNHPSGMVKPSQADIALTKQIRDAGKIMDITVLDHIILCSEEGLYYSFADEGNLIIF